MKAYMCCIVDGRYEGMIGKVEHVYTNKKDAEEHKEIFDEECFMRFCRMDIIEVELD